MRDSAQAAEAYISQLCGEPRNAQKRLGIAQLLRQMKKADRAVQVLDAGLQLTPGDPQLLEMKLTVCTEASNFRCASDVNSMERRMSHRIYWIAPSMACRNCTAKNCVGPSW